MHKLSDSQKRYAFEHCFDHLAHRNAKNVITCMECGHVWNGDCELADTLLGVVCPHCGKRLGFVVGRKRVYKEKEYFSIITSSKSTVSLYEQLAYTCCNYIANPKISIHKQPQLLTAKI